jgi:AcrR family transcriptional regulator
MIERVTGGPRFARETPDVRRKLLIEAAIHCLAEGGLTAFTIDRISRKANVSRGLINHHFDGIAGLLAAVYEEMTRSMYEERREIARHGTAGERLSGIIDTMFRPPMFAKSHLRAWLALWGEVATNPALKAAHRRAYDAYRGALTDTLEDIAKARGIRIDAQALATTCIALIDGLWIEWCLDAAVINRESARAAVYDVIEAKLGKLGR